MPMPPPDYYNVLPAHGATPEQLAAYRAATTNKPRNGFKTEASAKDFVATLPADVQAVAGVHQCWR